MEHVSDITDLGIRTYIHIYVGIKIVMRYVDLLDRWFIFFLISIYRDAFLVIFY